MGGSTHQAQRAQIQRIQPCLHSKLDSNFHAIHTNFTALASLPMSMEAMFKTYHDGLFKNLQEVMVKVASEKVLADANESAAWGSRQRARELLAGPGQAPANGNCMSKNNMYRFCVP